MRAPRRTLQESVRGSLVWRAGAFRGRCPSVQPPSVVFFVIGGECFVFISGEGGSPSVDVFRGERIEELFFGDVKGGVGAAAGGEDDAVEIATHGGHLVRLDFGDFASGEVAEADDGAHGGETGIGDGVDGDGLHDDVLSLKVKESNRLRVKETKRQRVKESKSQRDKEMEEPTPTPP